MIQASIEPKGNAMGHIGKGLIAGLAATLVLSALMVMKSMVGLMPELDLPRMLAGMMGSPGNTVLGWGVHLMIGIVGYGIALAVLDKHLPADSSTAHGALLALIGWFIMMLVLMPMVGAGLFALNMGAMAPMMTLVLHLIFGAMLGWTYGKLLAGSWQLAGSQMRR